MNMIDRYRKGKAVVLFIECSQKFKNLNEYRNRTQQKDRELLEQGFNRWTRLGFEN